MSSWLPLNYEQLNLGTAIYTPNTVYFNSRSYGYWCRSLFERIKSVIDIEGLPESVTGIHGAVDLLYYIMILHGFGVFTDKIENYGLVFQPCTLSGYNLYYSPKKALISNPAFRNSYELEIGKDCEILKLTEDYHGLGDIIVRYAEKLANLDNAIDQAINNSKLAYVGYSKNKAGAEALKLIMDKVQSGEPTVYMKKKEAIPLPDIKQGTGDSESPLAFVPVVEVKKNYILTDLIADQQSILRNFDTEIGIPSVPYQKKERMVTDEANSQRIDSQARANEWIECLNASAELVNRLYGLNISARLHFDNVLDNMIEEEGEEKDESLPIT